VKCPSCGFSNDFGSLTVCKNDCGCPNAYLLNETELNIATTLIDERENPMHNEGIEKTGAAIRALLSGLFWSALINGLLLGFILLRGYRRYSPDESSAELTFLELMRLGSLTKWGSEPLLAHPLFSLGIAMLITLVIVSVSVGNTLKRYDDESSGFTFLKKCVKLTNKQLDANRNS
jgi:hypothetical protein